MGETLGIQVDDAAMHMLVSKAILEGLTVEKRDELLLTSIKQLMVMPKGQYAEKVTPLQRIFEDEAQKVARMLIREELDKPAAPGNFRELTEQIIRGALEKCLDAITHDSEGEAEDTVREQISHAFADAIMKALRGF